MLDPAAPVPDRVDARQAAVDASEIRTTLLEMTKALKAQDLETLMGYYVNCPHTSVFGSYGKAIKGYDALRKVFEEEFKKQEPTDITTINEVHVVSYGQVAWVSSMTTRFVKKDDGRTEMQPARFSAVMEKHDGKWKVAHSHFSVAIDFEQTGRSKGK